MSSIRPLVTITVLVFVGVFLYWKITETEPVLPEGVDSWAIEQDIQIGDGLGASAGVEATSSSATIAPAAGGAPPFNPSSANLPSATGLPLATEVPAFNPSTNSAVTSAAPAWSPGQVTPGLSAPAAVEESLSEAKPAGADVAMAPINVPDLPPLPEIPALNQIATPPTETLSAATTSVPSLMTPEAVDQPALSTASPPVGVAPNRPPIDVAVQNPAQSSLFAATRLAVQAALDRGELSQALLLLSDWYGDPSLSPGESGEVRTLLSQLAGSVIYSTEPRLEAPYMVQAGESLEDVAKKYDVPWQLLAKINGITSPAQLQAGQELKVLRGPFSAVVDFSQRRLTLMLDRRYAGEFPIEFEPSISIEEGHWTVNQKLLTPAAASFGAVDSTGPSEDRSLTLTNSGGETGQLAILRGATRNSPPSEPTDRVIRLKGADVSDVFDILSLGSKVTIRR